MNTTSKRILDHRRNW